MRTVLHPLHRIIFKTGSRQCKRQVSIGAKTGIVRCGKL
jgi:hypothetical protein